MNKPPNLALDEPTLRRTLHDKIEQMDHRGLTLLQRVVFQMEAEEHLRAAGEAMDRERAAGRLTPERIQKVIDQFRAEHPFPA